MATLEWSRFSWGYLILVRYNWNEKVCFGGNVEKTFTECEMDGMKSNKIGSEWLGEGTG